MSYRELLEERLEEKAKKRRAFKMISRLFVASSSVIFLSIFLIWFIQRVPDLEVPASFYWNTVIILFSSGFLYLSVYFLKRDEHKQAHAWVSRTFWLGILFGLIQLLGWRQIFQDENTLKNVLLPVTGLHFLHIAIGLIFLWGCRRKIADYENHSRNLAFTRNVSFFWHFLTVVWVLFILAI